MSLSGRVGDEDDDARDPRRPEEPRRADLLARAGLRALRGEPARAEGVLGRARGPEPEDPPSPDDDRSLSPPRPSGRGRAAGAGRGMGSLPQGREVNPFDGVIFDLDGTLVENMEIHAEAFQEFLRRHDLPPLDAALRARIDGKRNRDIFPIVFGRELSVGGSGALFPREGIPLQGPLPREARAPARPRASALPPRREGDSRGHRHVVARGQRPPHPGRDRPPRDVPPRRSQRHGAEGEAPSRRLPGGGRDAGVPLRRAASPSRTRLSASWPRAPRE